MADEGISSIIELVSAYHDEDECVKKLYEPKTFDVSDDDARLPLVHHVISNFKAHIVGTYHGVTEDCLQSYADEFCWHYNHRGPEAGAEAAVQAADSASAGCRLRFWAYA